MATRLGEELTEFPLGVVTSIDDIVSYRRTPTRAFLDPAAAASPGFLVTIILRNGRSYDDIYDETGILAVTLDMVKLKIKQEDLDKGLYRDINLEKVFTMIEQGVLNP